MGVRGGEVALQKKGRSRLLSEDKGVPESYKFGILRVLLGKVG